MLHRGHEVWISDGDGRRLPEYKMEIDNNEERRVSCYIPSESGMQFIVHWQDYNGAHNASMHCSVDGMHAGRSSCRPNSGGSRFGVRTTPNTYTTFQFGELRTTDDDDALLAANLRSLEKVGTIEMRVHRSQQSGQPAPFKPAAFAGVGAIHERSKKLGAHCAMPGRAVKCRSIPHRVRHLPLVPGEGPYAIFVFQYRPAGLLQAQGIMPPPPPDAAQVPSGLRNGMERASSVARPPAPGPSFSSSIRPASAKKAVKAEPQAASVPTASRSWADGDVIELSDDDDEYQDRKPVRVKPEPSARTHAATKRRPKTDPDDVIDLTLDD
ncbi:hypothetical protein C8Q79DRAFT_234647 [Trametes meyenii]|nr:hypothetical protein C8Q79DRAFT_234647 [Trametes meyenii]